MEKFELYQKFSELIHDALIHLPLKKSLISKNIEQLDLILQDFEENFIENKNVLIAETISQREVIEKLASFCRKVIGSLQEIQEILEPDPFGLDNFTLDSLKHYTISLFIITKYPIDLNDLED